MPDDIDQKEESEISQLEALHADKPVLQETGDAKLSIDGKEISADIYHVELEQLVDGHHVLKVIVRELGPVTVDSDFTDVSKYTSLLGKSLSLRIEAECYSSPTPLEQSFIGVVTRVDLENSVHGVNVMTIIGHSPTILMDGARKNAFYRDQTATDIIGSIVGNFEITQGTIESSQGTLKFSVQYRETDYEYIMRLATNAGLFAYYDGQEFRVTKAVSTDVQDLEWRTTLGAFSLGLGTASSEFTTQVYDYEQKKTFTQDTKSLSLQASLSDVSKVSADASKKLYGDSGFSSTVKVVSDAQSLDKVLQRDRNSALGRMIIARGQSVVAPVAAGHCVKITGMNRVDATYWVTRVKHVLDYGSYYNIFECTPLDMAFPQYKSARPVISNLQMAVVLENNDPDGMGRVKVKFPWNEGGETPWIRFLTPHAGQERGWYCLPEVGDEVLVGYEQGSPDLPIALGALYNKENLPPSDTSDPDNSVKMFMTRSGNRIVLNDKDGSEQISIVSKDGSQVVLDSSGPAINIKTDGSINLEAQGDITIKGQAITLEGQGEVKVTSGADTKIEASMNMTAKAGVQNNIEGNMVNVKGSLIKLN